MELSSDGDLDGSSRQGQLPPCAPEKPPSSFEEERTSLACYSHEAFGRGVGNVEVELPDDVLMYIIFRSLDLFDLLRVESTCKKWYRLVSSVIKEFNLIKTAKIDPETKLGQLLSLFSHAEFEREPIYSNPSQLRNTEELILMGIWDDTVLSSLPLLNNLKILNITFSKLSSVGIENISRMNKLSNLSLLNCGFDRTCVGKIQGLKKLRGLEEIQVTKDTPLGIRIALKGLPLTEKLPQHCIPP